MAKKRKRLTEKQKKFVAEYLVDLNATQAAIRAGYSKRNAGKIGPELLGKTRIAEAIQDQLKAREKRTLVTADRVIVELSKIAFADLKDFVQFGPDGVIILPSATVDGTVLAEVSETETQSGGTRRIKLYDKLKALELLGKHLGMFVDKVEHSGDLELIVKLPDDLAADADGD